MTRHDDQQLTPAKIAVKAVSKLGLSTKGIFDDARSSLRNGVMDQTIGSTFRQARDTHLSGGNISMRRVGGALLGSRVPNSGQVMEALGRSDYSSVSDAVMQIIPGGQDTREYQNQLLGRNSRRSSQLPQLPASSTSISTTRNHNSNRSSNNPWREGLRQRTDSQRGVTQSYR